MELESLIVKLSTDITQFKKGFDEAEAIAKNGSGKIGTGFKVAGGIAAAGFTVLAGAATGAIAMASDWNGKLDEMMDKTGASSDEAAGLISMQEYLGGSMEDLSKMMVKMGDDASKSDGAIASLGISTFDSSGKMRSSSDIFADVANKLSTMPDGIEKTNLMMEIFGKTGSEAGDLLGEAANGGLQSYIDRANELGLATDPEKAIAFGKAQQELKQTMDGLAVTVGTNLMPVITPLITKFAELAAKYLPPLISLIEKNMIPIIIVLSAAFLIWAINAGIAAVSTIAALSPVILIILAIAGVVALLSFIFIKSWNTTKDFLVGLWEGHLKPIFEAIKAWFDNKIPKAMDALAGFWNNTLKPVIDGISGAFKGIGDAISDVIGWVQRLIDKFKNIKVPKILTPGSPTPFEIGLVGIGKAMKDLNNNVLPSFTSEMSMTGVVNPTSTGTFQNSNSEVIRLLVEIASKPELDTDELALKIRDANVAVFG